MNLLKFLYFVNILVAFSFISRLCPFKMWNLPLKGCSAKLLTMNVGKFYKIKWKSVETIKASHTKPWIQLIFYKMHCEKKKTMAIVITKMLAVTQLLMMIVKPTVIHHIPLSVLRNRNSWVIFALATMVTTVKIWHQRLCCRLMCTCDVWGAVLRQWQRETRWMWEFIIHSLLIMWELIMLLHSAPLLYIYLIVSSRKSLFFFFPLVNQNNIRAVWLLSSPYVIIWLEHNAVQKKHPSCYEQENRVWSFFFFLKSQW